MERLEFVHRRIIRLKSQKLLPESPLGLQILAKPEQGPRHRRARRLVACDEEGADLYKECKYAEWRRISIGNPYVHGRLSHSSHPIPAGLPEASKSRDPFRRHPISLSLRTVVPEALLFFVRW
jgi:hypothetical protein